MFLWLEVIVVRSIYNYVVISGWKCRQVFFFINAFISGSWCCQDLYNYFLLCLGGMSISCVVALLLLLLLFAWMNSDCLFLPLFLFSLLSLCLWLRQQDALLIGFSTCERQPAVLSLLMLVIPCCGFQHSSVHSSPYIYWKILISNNSN